MSFFHPIYTCWGEKSLKKLQAKHFFTLIRVEPEFFRNAKQLTDMEGATIRSEQGVTLALCLVSWIDSLLHLENYKQSTAGKLPKEPLTVPSIVRLAQYDNLETFLDRLQKEDGLLKKWCDVEQKGLVRKRKKSKELIKLQDFSEDRSRKQLSKAA